MLSLVQFLSGDSVAELYYPLMAKPELGLIFMPLLIIVTLGLMSLVPAILFENNDREKEQKRIQAHEVFQKLTEQLEHIVQMEGLVELDRRKVLMTAASFKNTGLGDFNLPDIFDILASRLCPYQQDPTLSVQELLNAVIDMYVFNVPLSTGEMLAQLRPLPPHILRVEADVLRVEARLNVMDVKINFILS